MCNCDLVEKIRIDHTDSMSPRELLNRYAPGEVDFKNCYHLVCCYRHFYPFASEDHQLLSIKLLNLFYLSSQATKHPTRCSVFPITRHSVKEPAESGNQFDGGEWNQSVAAFVCDAQTKSRWSIAKKSSNIASKNECK